MRRISALLIIMTTVLAAHAARAGASFTETFDTQTYAGPLDPAILWDTTAGALTLKPFQMSQVGSLTGMPGWSVDMVIRGDRLFMAAQSAGVLVMNIQSPASPSLYTIWSYGTVNGLDVEGDLAALATTNGTWLLDITDLAFPVLRYSHIGEQVGDVELVGNRAYVALNDSLRILDVSNPAAPKWLGSVALGGSGYRLAVQGGYVYCARGSNLSIVDVSNPTSPAVVAVDASNSSFVDVQVDGNHLYASIVDTGVRSYDVSDPTNPITLTTWSPGNYVSGIALSGNALYVAWRSNGVIHLDVSDPADPTVVSAYHTPGSAEGIAVSSRQTYVADGDGLQVLQNGGASLSGIRWYFADGDPQKVAVQGSRAYLAEKANGVSILSTAKEDFGIPVGHLAYADARDVAVDGHYAYVANGADGFYIADVSDPANPVTVFSYPVGLLSSCTQIELAGHLAYTRVSGLTGASILIWDVSDPAATAPMGSLIGSSLAGFSVDGGLAAFEDSGLLLLYDVSNPLSPAPISLVPGLGTVVATRFEGDVLYVAGGNLFRSYDVSDPTTPALIDTAYHTGTARDCFIEGNYAWLATDANSFLRVDVSDPAAMDVGVSSPGAARGVTVHGDEMFLARDDGRLEMWRTTNRRYLAPLGDATSANINPLPDAVVAARITPVHTPLMTFELSADGATTTVAADSAEWEYFTVPGPDLRWIATPLAHVPGAYPVMTELTVDMLYDFGQIESITDVGNDQGRQVRITWVRSGHDRAGSPTPIVAYDVYRQQVPGLAPAAAAGRDGVLAPQLAGWDYVATVPARADESYSVLVPTLADSTAATGIVYSTFMIRAVTAAIGVQFDSYPDQGYSVDNLAPMVPANAVASYATGDGNQLSWDPPVDEDFQYFRIYRDADPDFTPGPGNLVDATTAHAWTDPTYDASGVYYRISAVDVSGNESAYASPDGPTVDVADAARPALLQLFPGAPNPFRTATTLRFDLPVESALTLRVYDIGGRRVRLLASGRFEAGTHAVRWDGRDDAGRLLPPGLYLTRLSAGRVEKSQRIVRMK